MLPGREHAAGPGAARRWQMGLAGYVAALVLVGVLWAIIGLFSMWYVFRTRVSEPDLATIRRYIPVELPADTVLLDSYEEYSREMELLARLRLSHDSAKALLSRLPAGCEKCPPGEIDRPSAMRKVPSWWQPGAAPDRVCVRLAPPAARGYGQLVFAFDGDRVTLYLYWGSL